ncbi:hypothetical protein Tco_1263386 [Tanacetum coccineum]
MAAPIISISSDSSEESVGSHAPRVILFGAIPAIIPVIPEVPIVPADPIVTPEADGESEPAEQRLVSSSHDTLALSEFPLAPVVAPPRIRRRPATLIRPGEAIPFGRPYQTYLNGPHSSSSSSPSDHSLSGHTPPDTTDADSSTPQRFVHRSLARTPRRSEAFRRWRSAPLSTPYPPTTSDSSLGSSSKRSLDSSSLSSRPSHKRSPTPADLLPHRKSFRDSYSPEDSGEEHMEVDTTDAEAVVDVGISKGVVAYLEDGVGMGFEITASYVREDDEEFEGRG